MLIYSWMFLQMGMKIIVIKMIHILANNLINDITRAKQCRFIERTRVRPLMVMLRVGRVEERKGGLMKKRI